MRLPPGLRPGPRWGSYSAPQTPSWKRLGTLTHQSVPSLSYPDLRLWKKVAWFVKKSPGNISWGNKTGNQIAKWTDNSEDDTKKTLITRWCYFLSAVMINRWRHCVTVWLITRGHYYIVHQWSLGGAACTGVENGHWMLTLDCKKKTSISPTCRKAVENVETTYFDNCVFFAALATILLQFCVIHLSLASLAFCATYFTFLSGVFIVLSCWRYLSRHRYDFCAQIENWVVAESIAQCCAVVMWCVQGLSIRDMTTFVLSHSPGFI